ncbi:hypothetical protein SH528x_004236 [Novipirellula sp. SH528]|uniref:hypothetical protein n=1 Tax=Novipirellula sp. SH528 TaxID=3454466 RepID=UPI003FA02CE5
MIAKRRRWSPVKDIRFLPNFSFKQGVLDAKELNDLLSSSQLSATTRMLITTSEMQ